MKGIDVTIRARQAASRFAEDGKGATAVEFGLIMVPFLGLLLGTFQTGFTMWVNEGLEAAVQDASRKLMTGIAQGKGVYTAADFKSNYLCPATGGRVMPSFVDCSKLVIDVRTATAFASANTSSDFYANPTTAMFCPGGPADKVIVRVVYPMPVLLPTLVSTATMSVQKLQAGQTGNTVVLRGTAVFQNEPYPAASYVKPSAC